MSISLGGITKATADNSYAGIIPAPNGVDDSDVLQGIFDAVKPGDVIRYTPSPLGIPYQTTKTVYYPANVIHQMNGATIQAKAGWSGYPFQAQGQRYAVLAPPGLAAVGSTSGGTIAAGSQSYQVTAVTASGETMACPAVAVTTTGATSSVALSWTAPTVPAGGPAITGYNIYGRSTYTNAALVGTTAAGTTTFTDTGAATTVRAIPTGNATITRTAGIQIIGGTLDCNGPNRPCDYIWPTSGKYAGHLIDFQKVDGLRLVGTKLKNATKWAVAIADFTDLLTYDLTFSTQADGIHVLGPGDTWRHSGTKGTTGDDMHAVSLAEWPNYAVSAGNITSVSLSDATLTACPSMLRVLGAAGYKLGALTVEKVRGTYLGTFPGAIYLYDNQPAPGYTNGTDIDKVLLRDIRLASTGAGTNQHIYIGGRNLKRVTIEDVLHDSDYSLDTVNLYSVAAAATTCTIDDLTIRNVTRVAYTAGQSAVHFDNSVVVRNATLDGVTASGGLSGAGAYVASLGNATIDQLTARSPRVVNASGVGSMFTVGGTSLTSKQFRITDPDAQACFRLVDMNNVTSSVLSRLHVEGGDYGAAFGEVVRTIQTAAMDVVLRGVSPTAVANTGLVECKTGSNVTVWGEGNKLPSGKVIAYINGGTPTVRVNGPTLKADVSILTPTDGDLAFNTNGALGCGTGPACYQATAAKWKGLYSGATN